MKKNLGKILILSGVLTLIDQISKYFAEKNLQDGPFIIIKDFFSFSLSQNTGIAFGINIPYTFLIILNIFLIFFIFYLAQKELDLKKYLSQVSLIFLLGGALGNLIDRINLGYVVDFIEIWKWPNFNLADVFITLSILLILAFYGRIKRV